MDATVSGNLIGLANDARLDGEEYTGNTIGSVGIAEKYHSYLVAATARDACGEMQLFGSDSTETKIGDFTIKKGQGSNLTVAQKHYSSQADIKLKRLGKGSRFRRVIG